MVIEFKNHAKKVKLANVATEYSKRCENPSKSGFDKYIGSENINRFDFIVKDWQSTSDVISPMKLFEENDYLLVRRSLYASDFRERAPRANFKGVCSGDILTIKERNDNVAPGFLFCVLNSTQIWEYIVANASGSITRRIKWSELSNFEFLLPSIEIQQQIAELFQSIETAIDEVEKQERNLKSLWLNLINDCVSETPHFGSLLENKKLKKYCYSEVAEKLMRKIDPLTHGIERIVAGENLESVDFKIRTWQKVGEGYLGPAFHVLFKKGDILYGSRRTYLKKVAFADFDGVCANTTYVIRSNEGILLQGLLKHIMLSERFTQYSIGVSKGSTNPYINWKDLDNFELQLPDKDTQQEIVNVLDNILAIVEQLKEQKVTLKNLKQNLLEEIFEYK